MKHTRTGRPGAAPARRKPRWGFSGAGAASGFGLVALLVTAGVRLLPAAGLNFYNDDFVYLDAASRRGWLAALLHPTHVGGYLRPLSRDLYFALAYRWFGMDSWGYHLVNLGLALACAALVWLAGRRWIGPRGALLAAALFALSHVHAVLVGWISCDQDLWALLLALVSTWLLGRGWAAASAAAFALALLAKESVAPLPLILAGLGALEAPPPRAARRVLPHLGVLAVWAAVYLAFRGPESSLRWDGAAALALPVRFLLAAAGVEGGRLWPAALGRGLPWPLVAGAACVGAALGALRPGRGGGAGAAPGSARRALPWLLWAALGLVPVLPVAGQWSGYYFAFPLAGLCLAVGALSESWPAPVLAPLPALLLISGTAALHLGYNPSEARVDPSISSVSVARLTLGSQLVVAALRQIPAYLPSPPERALLVFNGMPRRGGLISGDGPAIRLLYDDPTLSACFLGEIDERTDFSRPMFGFSWDGKAGRFGFSPYTGAAFQRLKFDLEISGRTRGAIGAARYEHRHRDTGEWQVWNLGYLLWEEGDTAAAVAQWRSAGAVAAPDVRAARRQAAALPPGTGRFAVLLTALRAAPRDTSLLLAAARAAREAGNAWTPVLYFRACALSPQALPVLREARAALLAENLPTSVAMVDSLIARAPPAGPAGTPR